MEEAVQGIQALLARELHAGVIRPEGELSASDLRAIAQYCFREAQEERRQLIIDFQAVDHLDYRGVGALVAARQLLLRSGGDLKIAGCSTYLKAIVRAAGAQDDLELHPTLEDAQVAFLDPTRSYR